MNSCAEPTISIVCCTHNRVDFVRRHYQMLRERATSSCEIVYALDHCSDDTLTFLQGAAQSDPQLRFVSNQGTQGLFSCRNFAMDHARGHYIHYLDDDDAVSSGFYEAIDAAITAGLGGDMLLTNLVMLREGEPPRQICIVDRERVPTRIEGQATIIEGDLFDFILHGRLYFNSSNALISRELLLRQRFRAEIRKTADWLLYLELSHRQSLRLVYLTDVHALYFVHGSSMSIAGDKSYWNMKAFETLFKLVPEQHPHASAVRAVFGRALFDAGYAASQEHKMEAARYYWRSARLGHALPAMLAMAKLPFSHWSTRLFARERHKDKRGA